MMKPSDQAASGAHGVDNKVESNTIVFIHGMYMTPLCWEHWVEYFQAKEFRCLAPAWPGREQSVEVLRQRHPDAELAKLTLTDVLEHYAGVIRALDEKPILVGHSMGGLVVQLLLQRNLGAAGVAIHSAPPMGVLSARWSFWKSNWPHITPFASLRRPVRMSFERFQYVFANALPIAQQRAAHDRYVVPESRRVPRESLTARVDFRRLRPPLLLIAGGADHVIPAELNRANYARYRGSPGITDYREFAGRCHFTIGQRRWEQVADCVYAWLNEKAA
jgi:pimeloyl-ACP methyl ester carboxylesterase